MNTNIFFSLQYSDLLNLNLSIIWMVVPVVQQEMRVEFES